MKYRILNLITGNVEFTNSELRYIACFRKEETYKVSLVRDPFGDDVMEYMMQNSESLLYR